MKCENPPFDFAARVRMNAPVKGLVLVLQLSSRPQVVRDLAPELELFLTFSHHLGPPITQVVVVRPYAFALRVSF